MTSVAKQNGKQKMYFVLNNEALLRYQNLRVFTSFLLD